MAKRIKLENIGTIQKSHGHPCNSKDKFCPECGENLMGKNFTKEYVCDTCRHLIHLQDKFCPHCGGRINGNSGTEHYIKGKQISNEEYEELKKEVQ